MGILGHAVARCRCGPPTGHSLRPDFPFAFDEWIAHPAGLGRLPETQHGAEVAIVGAAVAGLVAVHELMKLGLKPVVYEASKMGGRLRSQRFEGAAGVIAELGGMRFPVSSIAFIENRALSYVKDRQ